MKKKMVVILVVTLLMHTVISVIGIMNETYSRESNTDNIQQLTGISFYQISYYWEKSTYINSNTGQIVVNIEKVKKATGLDSGYINVYSAQGWIIQNLPFFENSGYPQISMFFDLGQTGKCTSIDVHVEATSEPYAAFAYSGVLNPYPVLVTSYNAEGDEEPVSSHRPQPPLPGVPGENDFNEVGNSLVYTQNNHPNVQVADMQCVPAAYANNLQYLENEFGTPVDDELIKGWNGTLGSLTGQLDIYMERKSKDWSDGNGTNYSKGLNGFLRYVFFKNLQISVKHKGIKGNQDFTFQGVTSKGQGETISIDFILDEMKEGHAVALLYWRYISGQHTGGHMVQLTAAGKILDVPFIEFLHDQTQGDITTSQETGKIPVHTYLEDYDSDGKLNVMEVDWTTYGPPEAILLVIMEADNQPPGKPTMPFGGELTMKTGVEYEFTTSTEDPNGHHIWYLFDWGDGTNTSWIGPFPSGNTASASHIWEIEGIYAIKVKARDYYYAESDWSDERWSILPKIRSYSNSLFIQFIENYSPLFPLLQRLLGL